MSRSTSMAMSWPMTSLISRDQIGGALPRQRAAVDPASAKPGMTLVLPPARSTVGTAVFDSTAAMAAATPLSGICFKQEIGDGAVVHARQERRGGERLRLGDGAQIAIDDRGAMLRQPRRRQLGDGGADARDRVVFARHRAVTGAAGGAQLHPHRALLGDLDGIDDAPVHAHREAARFAERELGAHELGMVVDEPARAVVAARLLVGDAGEDDVALERQALALEARDDERGHHRHVLHVDGAAAPQVAVVDLAAERRMASSSRARRARRRGAPRAAAAAFDRCP